MIDAGLAHLEHRTHLEVLALWRTSVTDAGLVHLKGLIILHAAISETSSNCWKLSVISDFRLSAWVVESPSRTSSMAA